MIIALLISISASANQNISDKNMRKKLSNYLVQKNHLKLRIYKILENLKTDKLTEATHQILEYDAEIDLICNYEMVTLFYIEKIQKTNNDLSYIEIYYEQLDSSATIVSQVIERIKEENASIKNKSITDKINGLLNLYGKILNVLEKRKDQIEKTTIAIKKDSIESKNVKITPSDDGLSSSGQSEVKTEQFIRYSLSGGTPGDNRFVNILSIYKDGKCYYKTLEKSYEFTIKESVTTNIYHRAIDLIVVETAKNKTDLEPDSKITSLSIIEGKNISKICFYADENFEKDYPDKSRPDRYKELEKLLNGIVKENIFDKKTTK